MSRNSKAAAISIASNAFLLVLKTVIGFMTGSVAVLSAAVDSLNDLAASVIASISVRESEKPADPEHPYGHGKIENISSAIQAILIFAAAIYIVYEAVDRLVNATPVSAPTLGLVVMGITAAVNLVVSRYLLSTAADTDSAAIRANAYHLTTDVWTAGAVGAGLILVEVTGVPVFDPIVALLVAAVVIHMAFALTWEAGGILIDVRLPDEELRNLEEIVMRTPRVIGYHKLRTRKAGPAREIDYHLILPARIPLVEAHAIAEDIEVRMRQMLPNATVVTHIEPDTVDVTAEPDTEIRRLPTRRTRRSSRGSRTPPPEPEG